MDMVKFLGQFKLMSLVGLFILIGQFVGLGVSPIEAFPGVVFIVILAMVSLVLKDIFPLRLPAFAWATFIAFVLTLPMLPTSEFLMRYVTKVNFLATTTPILAFAGISVGNKIQILKKISWKLVVVSLFVFVGTFFGSAIIAHLLLKAQGTI